MKRKWIISGLLIFQAFNGLSAVLGGYMLITDPTGSSLGMKLEWLQSTPFSNFLIPGIVLLCINGLGNLIGILFTARKHSRAGEVAAFLGAAMMGWIIFQVIWIGYKSFLQPLYFTTGLFVLLLGLLMIQLRR